MILLTLSKSLSSEANTANELSDDARGTLAAKPIKTVRLEIFISGPTIQVENSARNSAMESSCANEYERNLKMIRPEKAVNASR